MKKVNSNLINMRERERERTLVIWALYDDAKSSYKCAIKKYFNDIKLEVYSIGINDISFKEKERFFYKKIDLSLINFNLINQLNQLPKPDIILASPPCESWSGADCKGRMFSSINNNHSWEIKNKNFYDKYNKICHPVKRRYFSQKEKGRILGEATIGATLEIIEHFNPKVWVIENPQTSLTWKFQKYHWGFNGILNLACYSAYDSNYSLKPTIFKSNIKFNLKKDRVRGNKSHMAKGSYDTRSSIPELLIKDLFEQILDSKELNNG